MTYRIWIIFFITIDNDLFVHTSSLKKKWLISKHYVLLSKFTYENNNNNYN